MSTIIVYEESGSVVVVTPILDCGLTVSEIAEKDMPSGINYQILNASAIPQDRIFRDAWVLSGDVVSEDLSKSKVIAHEYRRRAREIEFAPLDIKSTIPSESAAAEAARQVVRDKFVEMQDNIDAALSVGEVKAAILTLL